MREMMITNFPSQAKRLILVAVLVLLIIDALFIGYISNGINGALNMRNSKFQGRTHLYSRLPGRPKTRPSIAIVTHFSNDRYGQELKKLTWANKKKYAEARGYDIYDAESNPTIKSKIDAAKPKMTNFYYFKFVAMQEILGGGEATKGKHYDWVVWQDADSLFLNFGKKYEDIVDERFDVILTAGPPDNPTWKNVVNAGSFIIRNSDFSLTFLDDVLQMSGSHCGEFLIEYPEAGSPLNGWLHVCNADGTYWLSDQGILIALYLYKGSEYRCHFKKTWFRAFSSEFPWYGPGDLVVHFPGRSMDDRRKLIKAFNKFTNFKTGAIDYKYTDALDPDDSVTSDLVDLEELYNEVNPTCDAL